MPDLGQMRSVTWVLKEVDPVGLHRQSGIHSFSGKVGTVNRTHSNLKLHHITKNPSEDFSSRKMNSPFPGQRGPVLKLI